jgi:pilus assembly protein CpaF
VRNIARILKTDISPESPLLYARLPDGSRVAAVFPPCALNRTVLAIRKFHGRRYCMGELVRLGMLPNEIAQALQGAVRDRQNILISGSTGSGKTTFLNALADFIPEDERVIIIEDTAEIQIRAKHLVRLEARGSQTSWAAITMGDLLKATLRLRPDRILLGEVRRGEAFDLLQALNTGHSGIISTLHADSAALSLTRFTTCESGIELPYKALRRNIGDSLNILLHIVRRMGRRAVTEVMGVRGYDSESDRYEFRSLYEAPK